MSSLTPPDSNPERETGNTKVSRGASAKHWCFTLNNYTSDEITKICNDTFFQKYLFQEEIGNNGTPHLQGQITFKKKQKHDWWKKHYPRAHVEKTKSILDSHEYCIKEETSTDKIYSNWWHREIDPFVNGFKWWQTKIIHEVARVASDRKIWWLWEKTGGVGKSVFARYLFREKGAVIVSGKLADMKHCIAMWSKENGYPHIVIIDIPRSIDLDFFSYTGVEELKNGFFFSSKYEGAHVDMPRPHMFIFANEEPQYEKMSEDKWRVINIKDQEKPLDLENFLEQNQNREAPL
ncbi:Rep protein [Chicken circovirus 2]|nr:Rep protein [Chicken circovirus 2]